MTRRIGHFKKFGHPIYFVKDSQINFENFIELYKRLITSIQELDSERITLVLSETVPLKWTSS